MEKTFLGNSAIWYAFYRKFTTFSNFEKKINIFFKKTHISNALRNFIFSRILRQICYKLVIEIFKIRKCLIEVEHQTLSIG